MGDIDVVREVREFEGAQLVTYVVDGVPMWLASDVARALGYSRPDKLATNIRQRWPDDMVEGTDWSAAPPAVLAALRGSHQNGGTPLAVTITPGRR